MTLETIELLVLAHRVDGEAVGVEQRADVRAHLQHDLVDVAGGVDLVGDRLQLFLERQADVGIHLRPSVVAKDGAHLGSPVWVLQAMLAPGPETFNRHRPDS